MSHVRKQVREAAKSAIIAGVAAVSGRVTGVRGYGRNASGLPAIEVSTPGEQNTGETMDGRLSRNIELVVRIIVAGEEPEDQCDAIAVGIEGALYGSATLMGLVKELTPESMSFEMLGEAEDRVGQMELSWGALVHTFEADPETAI